MDTSEMADQLEFAVNEFWAGASADYMAGRVLDVVADLRAADDTSEAHCARTQKHPSHLHIISRRAWRCPGIVNSF